MGNANFFNWYKQNGADIKIGDNIFDYITPEEEQGYKQILNGVLAGKSFKFEKEYTFNDKVSIFEFDVFPAKDLNGTVMGVGFVTRDITERKRQEREIMDMNSQLLAQEEELRQNMEELQATQEQIQKAQKEILEQQQKTQAVIDGSPDNIVLMDTDYTIILANANFIDWYKKFGVEVKIGANIFDFIAPNEHEGYHNLFTTVLSGQTVTFETPYDFGGTVSYFELDFFPAKDAIGNIIGIGIITREITERKNTEALIVAQNQELNRQKVVLKQIVDALPLSVFWKDREGRYLGYNKPFLMSLARSVDVSDENVLIGKTDADIPWADVAAATWQEYVAVMDSGEAKINQEEQILMEGMPETWLRMSKIPLKDESGDTFGVIGMFEDITASKVKA
jgi:PAS domain S-box-containing protein